MLGRNAAAFRPNIPFHVRGGAARAIGGLERHSKEPRLTASGDGLRNVGGRATGRRIGAGRDSPR